jgi:hypothetical protein
LDHDDIGVFLAPGDFCRRAVRRPPEIQRSVPAMATGQLRLRSPILEALF